ncbi:hypothetical protein ANTQUA_LOCUS2413 [Anthophora quadrimaculata]
MIHSFYHFKTPSTQKSATKFTLQYNACCRSQLFVRNNKQVAFSSIDIAYIHAQTRVRFPHTRTHYTQLTRMHTRSRHSTKDKRAFYE